MAIHINQKGQAVAKKTMPMSKKDFEKTNHTAIYWMANASVMINSRGTNIMVDPLLEGFDMPLLVEMPILPADVLNLDALLVTHIDNDHFSRQTCLDLVNVCKSYHAPKYVADQMKEELNINGIGHAIDDSFMINDIKVTLTPTLHNWQNESKKYQYRTWEKEEYCGYWFDTQDGTIWIPGDSKLIDQHLQMKEPDVILFDFSDNEWHITFDGAIQLANTYLNSDLICIHYGSVDAPNMSPFNGNPMDLLDKVINPERIKILAPGEAYILGGQNNG